MKNKTPLILAIIFLAATILLISGNAHAAGKTMYATKTIKLSKDLTVKRNTKLRIIKTGKKCKVEYKDQQYTVKRKWLHKKKAVNKYKGRSFKKRGRVRWNKCSWTWYTTRQSCGKVRGVKGKHIGKRGFVFDKDGYIVLASGRSNKKKRKVVPTPFGYYGKVYDTNGGNNNKWFDVLTNW